MRVLIVEDNVDLYNDYMLRILSNVLPMDKIHLEHAIDLLGAAEKLTEKWDVILMDYSLGKSAVSFYDDKIKDGADLVALRRAIEENKEESSFIIGTSSNQVGNRLMVERGADTSYLKLHILEIAKEIAKLLCAVR